jgi:arylsulfatase A-like enzyme
LLDGVETRGLSERAWVVFVADHGESLGEDDYWFAHGEYLTDPLVRVPLMIRVPDRPARRRQDVASLVDLLPTLLPLAGVPTPSGLPGRNLLADNASEQSTPAYLATLRASRLPRIGLVSDGFKYLATVGNGSLSEQLYRLGDQAEDLASREPERLLRMRMKLAAVRRHWIFARTERKLELSQEDRERLEALGYFADR